MSKPQAMKHVNVDHFNSYINTAASGGDEHLAGSQEVRSATIS